MAKLPLTDVEEALIIASISYAEHKTSGELRVHMEPSCKGDAYARAVAVFEELKMHQTEARNGVLIYIAFDSKKYAIVGDSGIHQKLGEIYWEEVKKNLQSNFKNGNIAAAITIAVIDIGHQLSAHFPFRKNDTNELSNEISKG